MPSFSHRDEFHVRNRKPGSRPWRAVAIEYLPEPPRNEGEQVSYIASFTYGLLVARVYRTAAGWFAEGWTPETEGKTFGPERRRKDIALILVEAEHA